MNVKDITQKKNQINSSIHDSLNKIAKGSIVLLVGTFIGMILSFINLLIFARFFSTDEYGIFSIGIAIINIFAALGILGLDQGTTRQIAYYRSKSDLGKVRSVIFYSLIYVSISGILIFLTIFFCSEFIALKVLNISEISFPLKIFSIAIPFYIFIVILTSIYGGFKKIKEKVCFLDCGRNLIYLLFLMMVILLNLPYEWGIITYTLSFVITAITFFIYFLKRKPNSHDEIKIIKKFHVGKELLIFSFPILLITLLQNLISWSDTLMLGYFTTPSIVGLYNVAHLLSGFISLSLSVILFIYTPIISELYAQKKNTEIKQTFTILTKWLCFATFPLTMIFVLFPETILGFFFNQDYISASTALQIIAIGFFISNLMGPNGATLTAMGKTRFLMWVTLFTVCVNIGLNLILIPLYSLNGAAISSSVSIILINIIKSIKLYYISKTHSLKKNTIKPLFFSAILIIPISIIIKILLTITIWLIPFLFVLFEIFYGLSLFITKSIDKEDINIMLMMEKSIGIDLKKLKNFLKKLI